MSATKIYRDDLDYPAMIRLIQQYRSRRWEYISHTRNMRNGTYIVCAAKKASAGVFWSV